MINLAPKWYRDLTEQMNKTLLKQNYKVHTKIMSKTSNQRFFLIDRPLLDTDKQKPKLIKFTNNAVLP